MLTKGVTLHLGTTVLLAALITLNYLSLWGKKSFVKSRWFLILPPCFTASAPDDDGKNSSGTLWLLLHWVVHNIFKETLSFKSDKVMQRKTTVKAKCVQHKLRLSFIIIPSGSRISSSCNKDKSGYSKQEVSWLLQGLGGTCGRWGDLAWWHHMPIGNHFVRSFPLFLRQLSNHSGVLGYAVWGKDSHSARYYLLCEVPQTLSAQPSASVPRALLWSHLHLGEVSKGRRHSASRHLSSLSQCVVLIVTWKVPAAGGCPHPQRYDCLLSLKKGTYLLSTLLLPLQHSLLTVCLDCCKYLSNMMTKIEPILRGLLLSWLLKD